MGDDPVSGRPVIVRSGRFGRYMQIGLDAEKNRSTHSLPQWLHNSASLEEILEFARLPRYGIQGPRSIKTEDFTVCLNGLLLSALLEWLSVLLHSLLHVSNKHHSPHTPSIA